MITCGNVCMHLYVHVYTCIYKHPCLCVYVLNGWLTSNVKGVIYIHKWHPFLKCEWMSGYIVMSDEITHDDVIKWKHFPLYWPFVRGIHRSPVTRSFDVFFDLHLNKRQFKLYTLHCTADLTLQLSGGYWSRCLVPGYQFVAYHFQGTSKNRSQN